MTKDELLGRLYDQTLDAVREHIAGCAGAGHIIAINTDPGIPILAHADYAVIGNLHEVIPALVEALRAR